LQPIDAQSNGPQLLYGLRYHTCILASDEDATSHDQTGYWLWEPATGLVMQTLSIPRGQVAIAAGMRRRTRPSWYSMHAAATLDTLLNGVSRVCLPHRLLPSSGDIQRRRQLELRARHRAHGTRSHGTIPASGSKHPVQGGPAHAESANAAAEIVEPQSRGHRPTMLSVAASSIVPRNSICSGRSVSAVHAAQYKRSTGAPVESQRPISL